jgi:hypothetical protein
VEAEALAWWWAGKSSSLCLTFVHFLNSSNYYSNIYKDLNSVSISLSRTSGYDMYAEKNMEQERE